MARTVIDIDDKALTAAKEVLGTKTKVETVNAALREIAQRESRLDAARGLIASMPSYEEYREEQADGPS